ncbi:deoxyribonuclease nucA/nucB domain-containing protein [Ophiocordyceps camponoti-floridani]|uniref:Deoxyribonuclease nucA/nucB domain-containing protein n=1 Tax=Ophiocordyceps camponoti-floridani TaxID=2030778 RepID=A0A8H4VE32_9HYPO|nr:deoxyribonuclease nucA/nucB domain-containing protein [Ophiocordyceps camponoti-floridani]
MVSKAITLVLATAITGSMAATASPPDIIFLCDEMPDVCTNMCWAIRCANPTFSQQLTLDFPSAVERSKRLKSSRCSGCARQPPIDKGSSIANSSVACNAYPFPDTFESAASNGTQVTRCVPRDQQTKQELEIAMLAARFNGSGQRAISLSFGNPGAPGVKYCVSEPCENDGLEFQEKHKVEQKKAKMAQKRAVEAPFRIFEAKSGMTIASMGDVAAGHNFIRRVAAKEKLSPLADTWHVAFEGKQHAVVRDSVVREMKDAEIRDKAGGWLR